MNAAIALSLGISEAPTIDPGAPDEHAALVAAADAAFMAARAAEDDVVRAEGVYDAAAAKAAAAS